MYKIPCRCGASIKQFKKHIGPFYLNECCAEAGFDDLGNPIKILAPELPEEPVSQVNKTIEAAKNLLKPGRGKLMDMNVQALKELAKSKDLEIPENLNKKQIVELLLK